jgi:hypothetical protein
MTGCTREWLESRESACPGSQRSPVTIHAKPVSPVSKDLGGNLSVQESDYAVEGGAAGLAVAYRHAVADQVEPAVTRAVQMVVGEAEGHHVQALKGALADAQKKMAEGELRKRGGRHRRGTHMRNRRIDQVVAWPADNWRLLWLKRCG